MNAPQLRLSQLENQRALACRLTPERALATLEEAEAFLLERGLLTLTPNCTLPSLFGACHEEPYAPGVRGFGTWPRTKWWWHAALAARPGVLLIKLHRGKSLYLSPALVTIVDPLCREALARAEQGARNRSRWCGGPAHVSAMLSEVLLLSLLSLGYNLVVLLGHLFRVVLLLNNHALLVLPRCNRASVIPHMR